jgi:hypothetical protein
MPLSMHELLLTNNIFQAVCVSACGNFGLVGSSTGAISMWNMQSGIKRKAFEVGPRPPEVVAAGRDRAPGSGKKGESRSITGLATDALNRVAIATTLDGTVVVCYLHADDEALANMLVVLRFPFHQARIHASASFHRRVVHSSS